MLFQEEIICRVLSYLDLVSLSRLALTCRHLHRLCSDPLLYSQLDLQVIVVPALLFARPADLGADPQSLLQARLMHYNLFDHCATIKMTMERSSLCSTLGYMNVSLS